MLLGRYSAVLDACVLHPVHVRSALLWLAADRMYRPLWSETILGECQASIKKKYPDLPEEKVIKNIDLVRNSFPEAIVEYPESLCESLDLPDDDDKHVLAAAICGKSDAIVTANIKHFPKDKLAPFNIEIIHPDTFVVNVFDLERKMAIEALKKHRASLSKSKMTQEEYIEKFNRCGMPQTSKRLESYVTLL